MTLSRWSRMSGHRRREAVMETHDALSDYKPVTLGLTVVIGK